jgi:hypothetical protein
VGVDADVEHDLKEPAVHVRVTHVGMVAATPDRLREGRAPAHPEGQCLLL